MELVGIVSLVAIIVIIANANTTTREDTQNAINRVKGFMIRIPLMILGIGLLVYSSYAIMNAIMPDPTPSPTNVAISQVFDEIRPKIFNGMLVFAVGYVAVLELICLIAWAWLADKLSDFRQPKGEKQ